MRLAVVALLAALGTFEGLGSRAAAAQHEHHHGSGQTPDHDAGHAHHHEARAFEAGVAVEGAVLDGGGFQGVAPTLAWMHGRFGVRLVVPVYRIDHYGFDDAGPGDVIVSGHAGLVSGDDWMLGVVAAVGLPTGDPDARLGMGHVMVMPSLFVAIQRGDAALTVHAGGGHNLGGDGDHVHAPALVSPMNASELGGSIRGGLAVAADLALHATAGVAVPVGDGVTRSTAGAGARYRLARGDVGFEVHVPIAGDPYLVRMVADVAYRF